MGILNKALGGAPNNLVSGGDLGTPSAGVLTNCSGYVEANLTLTDVTTNNASTSKHGFLKKLSNVSTEFMNGEGDWATPATTLPAGTVVQVVNTQTGAVASGSTTIPYDDTIPQNTEGDQYMSLAITPTAAANILKIDVVFNWATNANVHAIVALFQDSTANALAAVLDFTNSSFEAAKPCTFTHYMTAGTTSSTTFKVRAGMESAATLTFNGVTAARKLGGVNASSITITEIKV